MAKVLLKSVKDPAKTKLVNGRDARTLVKLGGWEYADAAARAAAAPPAPSGPNYAGRSVTDLRRLARERELDGLGRATKADLVAALTESDRAPARGTYERRDLRATEE